MGEDDAVRGPAELASLGKILFALKSFGHSLTAAVMKTSHLY